MQQAFWRSVIGRWLPASWVDQVRFRMHQFRFRRANQAFAQAHADVVFPPDYYLYETYRLQYSDYWLDGRQTAEEIVSLWQTYGLAAGPVTVVDWGCGPGRVLRHLPELLPQDSLVVGTDYNAAYVNWCRDNLPEVTVLHQSITPPLPLQSGSCDAVFGLSILTHLSEEQHKAWLAELQRILKPDGLIVLTTHGSSCAYKLTSAERESFDSGKLVVRAAGREGHRVFAAFQPQNWMRSLATDTGLAVAGFIPGASPKSIHGEQDTWIFKRAAEG